MFNKINIKYRIIISIAASVLLVTILLMYLSMIKINDIFSASEQKELKAYYGIAISEINNSGKFALGMATLISKTPEIQKDFAEQNRDMLANRSVPLFKILNSDFSVKQFQFHNSPAISFFRAHKPEKFGDDLSSFRKTVVATNTSKEIEVGLEKGVAGIGVRGIVPMEYDNQHTGSVEIGMSFGQSFFENFKKSYDVDISLYVLNNNKLAVFGSTLGKDIFSEPDTIKQILSGTNKEAFSQKEFLNIPRAVYLHSVLDYSGNPIGVLEIVSDRSHDVSELNSVMNLFLIIGITVFILGCVAAIFISRSITKPIIFATEAMNEIAEGDGDLTKRLPETSKDEVGALAKAFNTYSIKVHETVFKANNASIELAGSAEKLSAITAESDKNISRQREETEQVATAMNQMVATVHEIAKNASDASDATQNANEATSEGSATVDRVINSIGLLVSEIKAAEQVIIAREEESNNIDSVLTVIKNIAEQTNLLALNAAIEAARAGEHGRGFAVVADEVRQLATKTQQSTSEIQNMVEALQSGSKQAVNAMQKSIERSDDSVEIAQTAGTALNRITGLIQTINDMNLLIASAATEQVSVSEEINKNIFNINDVVVSSTESAAQVSQSSEDLANLALDLQNTMEQFKI